jgi:hypothetical protein
LLEEAKAHPGLQPMMMIMMMMMMMMMMKNIHFKSRKHTSLFNTLIRDAKFPNTRSLGQLHFV